MSGSTSELVVKRRNENIRTAVILAALAIASFVAFFVKFFVK